MSFYIESHRNHRFSMLGLIRLISVITGSFAIVANVPGQATSSPSEAKPATITQLTRVSQDEPVMSPDGKTILFQSDIDGPFNLFMMDREGRHIVRLTRHKTSDDGGIWSPDGKQVAFSSTDRATGISEIFVISAVGSREHQITHDRAFNIHPAWSPDGRSIMYTSTKESKDPRYGHADVWQTYVVSANGKELRKLAVEGPVNTYGSWSPDGSRILIRRKPSNESRISQVYVMNADGTGLTNLTNDSSYNRYPSWSPSGRQIVFTSDRAGHSQILLMNADGGDTRVLVDGPGTLTAPRFTPDGKAVLYSRDFEDELKIFSVPVP